MIILSIETSCDETAVSILKAEGSLGDGSAVPTFTVLGNAIFSQIELHKEYGGVFPTLAKREHGKNLVPLTQKALTEAGLLKLEAESKKLESENLIREILSKEGDLSDKTVEFLEASDRPFIDMIAVTSGPGLEPALWVGISFAKALGEAWKVPVVGTNHMKGHIASVLLQTTESQKTVDFPAIALLISGGHTEIVHIEKWGSYSMLGQTRDDAVGEAFDKVARMIGLPYPGGPEISKLASRAREINKSEYQIKLPRPMLHSKDLDFSFSGLKTSVLYTLRDLKTELTEEVKMEIAKEFEDAVVEVLLHKTEKALVESGARTLVIAGGVIANKHIREAFTKLISEKYPDIKLMFPEKELSTDNAVMIAIASYLETLVHPEVLTEKREIKAQGNMSIL
jgi:N6-L-threonylcarbamoyladenine synthase